MSVRRDNGVKAPISRDIVVDEVSKLLQTIQKDMFEKARNEFHEHIIKVRDWKDFVPALDANNVCLIPWCEKQECEGQIKSRSKSAPKDPAVGEDERAPSMGAKSLCIPRDQPTGDDEIKPGETKCINCGSDATCWGLFGRSY